MLYNQINGAAQLLGKLFSGHYKYYSVSSPLAKSKSCGSIGDSEMCYVEKVSSNNVSAVV